MLGRVGDIDTASQHRDRPAPRFTPASGCGDLIFGGFENLLGGAETLEQQAAGARPGAVDTSEREPISVGGRGQSASRAAVAAFETEWKFDETRGPRWAYLYLN